MTTIILCAVAQVNCGLLPYGVTIIPCCVASNAYFFFNFCKVSSQLSFPRASPSAVKDGLPLLIQCVIISLKQSSGLLLHSDAMPFKRFGLICRSIPMLCHLDETSRSKPNMSANSMPIKQYWYKKLILLVGCYS